MLVSSWFAEPEILPVRVSSSDQDHHPVALTFTVAGARGSGDNVGVGRRSRRAARGADAQLRHRENRKQLPRQQV